MKTKLFTAALFLLFAATSCDKDASTPDEQNETIPETGKITIGNQVYTAVKIGDQLWTNSNYTGEGGIPNDAAASKPEYGKYYTYEEMQKVNLPQGWRIPTENDYRKLLSSVGVIFDGPEVANPDKIKSLASKTNWKHVAGTNISGFNAYPGGYSVGNASAIDGDIGEFWLSDGKTFCIMERGNYTAHRITFYAKSNDPQDRFNLRFVKDVK